MTHRQSRGNGMKINKKWLTITIICLILTIGSLAGFRVFSGKTEGIEDVSISTGNQNKCLIYDKENALIFVEHMITSWLLLKMIRNCGGYLRMVPSVSWFWIVKTI